MKNKIKIYYDERVKVRKDKEQINIGNSGNIDANCKLIKIKEKFHEDAVDDLVIKESDIFDF